MKGFEDYWKKPSSLSFPEDHKLLRAWCKDAFKTGCDATRMKAYHEGYESGMKDERARCAKIAKNLDVDSVGMDSNGGITNAQNTWAKGSMDTSEAISEAIRRG